MAAVGGVIFLDVAYTGYFNSMYSEPTAYVCLFLLVGALLNIAASKRIPFGILSLFIISAGFLVTAKAQTAVLAIVIAGLLIWLGGLHASRVWKWSVIAGAISVVAAAALVYASVPASFQQPDEYDRVFFGIVYGVGPEEVSSDLRSLGVDTRYAYLAGQYYWTPTSQQVDQTPAFVASYFSHATTGSVLRFYLTHPATLSRALQRTADVAAEMRPANLGNYTTDAGRSPTEQTDRLDLWSSAKARFFPRSLWVLVLGWLAYFAGILWEFRRARDRQRQTLVMFCAAIGLMTLVSFPIPYVFSGEAELAKHLFTYEMLSDLMLVIACAWLVQKVLSSRWFTSTRGRPVE
jgi:hypothetical protein